MSNKLLQILLIIACAVIHFTITVSVQKAEEPGRNGNAYYRRAR